MAAWWTETVYTLAHTRTDRLFNAAIESQETGRFDTWKLGCASGAGVHLHSGLKDHFHLYEGKHGGHPYSVPFVHFCNYYRNYYPLNSSISQLFGMFTLVYLLSYIMLLVNVCLYRLIALTYLACLQYIHSAVPLHNPPPPHPRHTPLHHVHPSLLVVTRRAVVAVWPWGRRAVFMCDEWPCGWPHG